jgi:hypothetical protein
MVSRHHVIRVIWEADLNDRVGTSPHETNKRRYAKPGICRARRDGERMTVEPGWVLEGIDTSKANIARVYDYWLSRARRN